MAQTQGAAPRAWRVAARKVLVAQALACARAETKTLWGRPPRRAAPTLQRVRTMRILVTFAVEAEFAPWRKLHDFRSFKIVEGAEAYQTIISGIEVIVGLTGIGPEAASRKTCDFTWGEVLDLCITTGFAGAFRPHYQLPNILPPHEIVADEKRTQQLGRKVESTQRLLRT